MEQLTKADEAAHILVDADPVAAFGLLGHFLEATIEEADLATAEEEFRLLAEECGEGPAVQRVVRLVVGCIRWRRTRKATTTGEDRVGR